MINIPSPRTSAEDVRPVQRVGRIEDLAYMSDLRSGALVDRDGTISWMCWPRFDSPAHFAALLGTEKHGVWRVGPARSSEQSPAPADRRRYIDGTLVVESSWITSDGTVQLVDFMAVTDDDLRLVRIVRGVSGRVPMRSTLRARPGYGRPRQAPGGPQVHASGRLSVADQGDGRLWLDTQTPCRVDGPDIVSEFTVSEGEEVAFVLSWRRGHDEPPPTPAPAGLLTTTQDFWVAWAGQSTYSGPHRDAVERSLITLKALQYQPTGAFVAAATTSLPEEIGGNRQWDYRFCWPRDSALTVEALLSCGYKEEARAWVGWLKSAIAGRPETMQAIYRVDGGREMRETELGWLPGFEGSVPVRTGNGAAGQLQLDVYGEIVSALYATQEHDPGLTPVVAPLIVDLVACLEQLWELPDEGIWEVRGPRRHFVHSKVMAWLAVDRAVRLIEAGRAEGPLERWQELRDAIHQQVCERGYDEERNTFTQSYGSAELDASLLQIVTSGFLPPEDKRVIGTVEAVQRELSTQGGFLLRYRTDGQKPGVDGLTGDEGTFVICLAWLIKALAAIGRVDEAEIHLGVLLGIRSDLGLLAEEWDPYASRQLGNSPQAFSLVGIVVAVLAVTAARRASNGQITPKAATV
ncbi:MULTISPECIES: glycoside hydrolase family 15 protein [Streptomyces]|uniref:Trehalase n=2 Tax=Streptomyces TaxID=1883 RepID=A0A117IUZ2_9ACTN|nr:MULTISPECIES: glycoside hydrolase family 15 protein [Streptomyces]KUH36513.1 glucoamylase [Streptomyces kanasensis]UUS34021.1 glycoside hydrolase family 15 protein [Streptomyces changanensis]